MLSWFTRLGAWRKLSWFGGLILVGGCGGGNDSRVITDHDELRQVVYLCRESKQPVRAPLQDVPAVHPVTGRKTLYRALYCDQCDRWYPLPPDDGRNHSLARLCPKHRLPMAQEGKLP